MQRLQHHVPVPLVEIDQGDGVRTDQGRRRQAGELGHQQFLGRATHLAWVVHHQGLGMHRLQQIGRGHIGHVERRILAHQDHVDVRGQVQLDLVAEGHMVPDHLAQGHRPRPTEQSPVLQRQGAEIIDPLLVPPVLSRRHHQPGRVAVDVHRLERVHLDGDLQHRASFVVVSPAHAREARFSQGWAGARFSGSASRTPAPELRPSRSAEPARPRRPSARAPRCSRR